MQLIPFGQRGNVKRASASQKLKVHFLCAHYVIHRAEFLPVSFEVCTSFPPETTVATKSFLAVSLSRESVVPLRGPKVAKSNRKEAAFLNASLKQDRQ